MLYWRILLYIVKVTDLILLVRCDQICVLVELPAWDGAQKLVRAARMSWANNMTFFASPRNVGPWNVDGLAFPISLRILHDWIPRIPRKCSWLLHVPLHAYVNLANVEERLRCLSFAPNIAYLGTPKLVASGNDPVIRVADSAAGIILRRHLLDKLIFYMESCVTAGGFSNAFLEELDVALGICLWIHGIEMHSWLDPAEEVFYRPGSNVIPYPGANSDQDSPFQRVNAHHGGNSFGTLQCVFIVSGLLAKEVTQLHALLQKSKRWFRNIACIPGGLTFPELTSAHMMVRGQSQSEPVFSPMLRKALQDCFLSKAFDAYGSAAEAARHGISSPQSLADEWQRPRIAEGSAVERLQKGGHHICVFVPSTAATLKHLEDEEAVIKTWASPADLPAGVETFIVRRLIEHEQALQLRGDVDLGFLYNPVRILYLWRYLAAHHAEDCAWFAKVDADTFLNTRALSERLSRYFDPEKPHYLGSLKATVLGSGRRLDFAINAQVLSRGLL